MKFSLDEELQCVSEPEMSRRNGKTKHGDKAASSDAKNRSWIVQASKTKKSKRRKKGVTVQIKSTNEQKIENQPEISIDDNDTTIEQHAEVADLKSAYKYADLVRYFTKCRLE